VPIRGDVVARGSGGDDGGRAGDYAGGGGGAVTTLVDGAKDQVRIRVVGEGQHR
jgi:hypothetical protein